MVISLHGWISRGDSLAQCFIVQGGKLDFYPEILIATTSFVGEKSDIRFISISPCRSARFRQARQHFDTKNVGMGESRERPTPAMINCVGSNKVAPFFFTNS